MVKLPILLEILEPGARDYDVRAMALGAPDEAASQGERMLQNLPGYGLELVEGNEPVPMFLPHHGEPPDTGAVNFSALSAVETSTVVNCIVDSDRLDALRQRPDVRVWPNSALFLYSSAACPPWGKGVGQDIVQKGLAVASVWAAGFNGEGIVVAVVDEGIDGSVYPVVGGYCFNRDVAPGRGEIRSHGSMVAADILTAAPAAKLADYRFSDRPDSWQVLDLYQAILTQRRQDGTPHLTNNSFGFVSYPSREKDPNHEVWDIDHPLNRKIREVVASGCCCYFAVGNCGSPCPQFSCSESATGPGRSICGPNSLEEVVTVAAVNAERVRVGYSAQGPGLFARSKPDLAAFTHFFANFGPGRPAGGDAFKFDEGTSAAAPLAAGVGALLLQAFPTAEPARIKEALIASAGGHWDADLGHGVVNAEAAYQYLKQSL